MAEIADVKVEVMTSNLSKREYFSLQILASLLSGQNAISISNGIGMNEIKTSIYLADSLIKQLNEKE
jgi:hypothetical protein